MYVYMGHEKFENILSNTDKTIFISTLEKPLISLKRISLIATPLSELENGFSIWLTKLNRLSQELSIPLMIYGEAKTHDAILEQTKKSSLNIQLSFTTFSEWEDILIISRYIKEDDLLVMVTSRKGSVSYENVLENIPSKLEKHFEQNSKILIYPRQQDYSHLSENYEDITRGPLSKGIETIGKGIQSIFRFGKSSE